MIHAFVESHHDIGAESALDVHGAFGGEHHRSALAFFLPGAKLKAHALFCDLTFGQTEDLKSSRVRQNRLVPSHHRVETTETFDDLRSVKDPQMVCIGKHNLRAGGCDLIGQNTLDRGLSSHRHERWRFDLTVRGHKPTTPRAAAGGQ